MYENRHVGSFSCLGIKLWYGRSLISASGSPIGLCVPPQEEALTDILEAGPTAHGNLQDRARQGVQENIQAAVPEEILWPENLKAL